MFKLSWKIKRESPARCFWSLSDIPYVVWTNPFVPPLISAISLSHLASVITAESWNAWLLLTIGLYTTGLFSTGIGESVFIIHTRLPFSPSCHKSTSENVADIMIIFCTLPCGHRTGLAFDTSSGSSLRHSCSCPLYKSKPFSTRYLCLPFSNSSFSSLSFISVGVRGFFCTQSSKVWYVVTLDG